MKIKDKIIYLFVWTILMHSKCFICSKCFQTERTRVCEGVREVDGFHVSSYSCPRIGVGTHAAAIDTMTISRHKLFKILGFCNVSWKLHYISKISSQRRFYCLFHFLQSISLLIYGVDFYELWRPYLFQSFCHRKDIDT